MEIVGCTASVTQLIGYIATTATCVRCLHETFKNAPSLTKSHLEDLNVLLKTLDFIKEQQSHSNTTILIPVLISITNTVQTLSNWFNQANTHLRWLTLVVRKVDIAEAFQLLRHKCNLLILYFSQQNNSILNRIESRFIAQNLNATGPSRRMNSLKVQDTPAVEVIHLPPHIAKAHLIILDTDLSIRTR